MNLMSEQINELTTALAKAQGEIQPALKDTANPFFKSKYADLASVWDACRQPLSKNGLAIIQTVQEGSQGIVLETILSHSSGQWMKSRMPILCNDNKPQTLGSAMTYARRYALSAMVGVAPEDDDGEAAQGRLNKPTSKVTINDKQLSQLKAKLNGHEDVNKKILDHLTKSYQISSYDMLTSDLYESIIKFADTQIQNKYKQAVG